MGLRWGWEHPPGQQGGSVFTAKRKSARALYSPWDVSRGVFFLQHKTQRTQIASSRHPPPQVWSRSIAGLRPPTRTGLS